MERLEQELSDALPINALSVDASQEFEQRYAYLKDKMIQSSMLKDQKDSLAQVLALRNYCFIRNMIGQGFMLIQLI